MTVKIWIAGDHDTLSIIADRHSIPVGELVSLNPHIRYADGPIAGKLVYLPWSDHETVAGIPQCPPETVEPLPQWIPLTPLEEMTKGEYDVLIVGSGAGGAAALWRLCERWRGQNKRIGIIDRGNLLLPTHARNLPMMNTERLTRYFVTVSQPLPRAEPDFAGARQLFAAGGRSLFWYAFAIRMNLSLLPDWPIPASDMEEYYNIAEQAMNVTRMFSRDSTFTEVLLKRLWQSGYANADYIPLAADLLPSVYGRLRTDIFNSSFTFLSTALNIRPFDFAVNARAVEILHHQGKVSGVKVMTPDKSAYTIKAKTVILSASTIETPRLLLHSGIRNRSIGHYLMNHSFVQATGSVDRFQFPISIGVLGITVPPTQHRPFLLLMAGPGTFYWYQPTEIRPLEVEESVLFFGYGKVTPRYDNRITLNPFKKDAYGVPEIEVYFSFTEEELDYIRQMTETIRHISASLGIRLESRNGRPPICLFPPGELHHDSGTCRIGNDPSTSAADPYGQIWGYTGLYVADSSALPQIGSENPKLTIVALAIRTADHIAGLQS